MSKITKCMKEIKSYLFYGKTEGKILAIETYMDFTTGKVYNNLVKVILMKKINVFGKEKCKYKELVVNLYDIKNFKEGDYFCYE